MINIDQHVHSKISHDGKSTMNEHMNNAKNHNICEITFTTFWAWYFVFFNVFN